jgi:hypothetical protein
MAKFLSTADFVPRVKVTVVNIKLQQNWNKHNPVRRLDIDIIFTSEDTGNCRLKHVTKPRFVCIFLGIYNEYMLGNFKKESGWRLVTDKMIAT